MCLSPVRVCLSLRVAGGGGAGPAGCAMNEPRRWPAGRAVLFTVPGKVGGAACDVTLGPREAGPVLWEARFRAPCPRCPGDSSPQRTRPHTLTPLHGRDTSHSTRLPRRTFPEAVSGVEHRPGLGRFTGWVPWMGGPGAGGGGPRQKAVTEPAWLLRNPPCLAPSLPADFVFTTGCSSEQVRWRPQPPPAPHTLRPHPLSVPHSPRCLLELQLSGSPFDP